MRIDEDLGKSGEVVRYKSWPVDVDDAELIDLEGQIDDNGVVRAMTDDEIVDAREFNRLVKPSISDAERIAELEAALAIILGGGQ